MPSAPAAPAASTSLDQARALARVLDNLFFIPGTKYRIGLDPLIGLIPGLGDAVGASMAGYHVLLAAKLGAPPALIARMLGNVAVDMIVGAVPFVGDFFDAGWKANAKNLALLERWIKDPKRTRKASAMVVTAALVTVIGLTVLGMIATFWLLATALNLLSALF